MPVRIKHNSRLHAGGLKSSDGSEFIGAVILPVMDPRDDDTDYLVQAWDRLDVLAKRFYGDETLWWVIAHRNGIDSMLGGMKYGELIQIPSASWVQSTFLPQAKRIGGVR